MHKARASVQHLDTVAEIFGSSPLGVLHGNLKKNFVDNDHRISCNTAGTAATYRGLLLTSAQVQITPLRKNYQLFVAKT